MWVTLAPTFHFSLQDSFLFFIRMALGNLYSVQGGVKECVYCTRTVAVANSVTTEQCSYMWTNYTCISFGNPVNIVFTVN